MFKMLAAVQLDDKAHHFVERAGDWAARLGAKLDLVTTVDPVMAVDPFTGGGGAATQALSMVEEQRAARETLQGLLDRVPMAWRGTASTHPGPPATALIHMGSTYDLVVLGTHQREGIGRLLLGSVAERVLRNSPCPVLVLPPGHPSAGLTEILVPLDPYHFQRASIDWVRKHLPEISTSAVYALPWLEVFGPVPLASDAIYERAKTALSEKLEAAGHKEVDAFVAVGEASHAGDVIAQQAELSGTSLVVMNTHGRKGLSRLVLGSVAERVVRHARMPVLVIRSADD